MYETMLPGGITSNTFHPQCFVNISSTIDFKIKSNLLQFVYDYDKLEFEKADFDEEPVNEDIEAKLVIKALNELPVIYKTVLNMYAIDGLTHKEIAKQLGISEGSSKSRLSRGRSMLNAKLKRKK